MQLAPIVLFAYNRPWHVKQTLESLSENTVAAASDLFIYVDGPKSDASNEDLQKIREVKNIVREKQWCKSVSIVESQKNKGLGASVIHGVSEIIEQYGRVIVVEDDVVTSPYFLSFMNDALLFFQNEERVQSIGSWNYFTKNNESNFFLSMPDTIAWATWKRSWIKFEPDALKLQEQLRSRGLMNKFNLNDRFDFEKMLQDQVQGKISSWAIRWTAVAVLNNSLCFYPSVSLSKHIGFGNDSTNSEGEDYNKNLVLAGRALTILPVPIEESEKAVNDWLYIEKVIKKSGAIIDHRLISKKILLTFARKIKSKINQLKKPVKSYGWFGNYTSWLAAQQQCTGYDSGLILEKVKASVLKVKSGEAKYERDSVLFDEVQYSQPLLDAFKKIADENKQSLSVVDFGGSLGSTYFQNRNLLNALQQWSVVEQKHFVDAGKKEIEEGALKFYYTIEEALQHTKAQVLLLSSVIQYFEKPYELIEKCIAYGFDYIIVDRTAFVEGNKDRLTVQIVPEFIYKASYPAWFFNEEKFIKSFLSAYELKGEFDSQFDPREKMDKQWSYRKGFVFKRKK